MRSSSLLLLAVAAIASAAASVACGAPSAADTSVSEGELTKSARKGDEFVRCWTVSDGTDDEFFREYALTCRVSSKGLPGLAGTLVNVDAIGVNGTSKSASPGDTPDQDVVIGRVHKSDFPLSLHVYGSWAAKRTDTISEFQQTVQVANADAPSATAPVVFKLPFDSWPVTFLMSSSFAAVSAAPYNVQAAPFITESGSDATKTTFSTSFDSGAIRDSKSSFDLIAPPSGGVAVEVQAAHGTFRSTINAPGVYVIEDSALRLATAEEEAAAGVASNGSATSSSGGPSSPSSPAAPTTTCGGPHQTHCEVNGNSVCSDGTRNDSDSGICLPCGNDGQTHCVVDPRNVTGNYRCNAGTRYDSNSDTCIACGSVGKVYCVSDPNNVDGNAVCNAGLHYNSDGICVN